MPLPYRRTGAANGMRARRVAEGITSIGKETLTLRREPFLSGVRPETSNREGNVSQAEPALAATCK